MNKYLNEIWWIAFTIFGGIIAYFASYKVLFVGWCILLAAWLFLLINKIKENKK